MLFRPGFGHIDEGYHKIVFFPKKSDKQLQQEDREEVWQELKY